MPNPPGLADRLSTGPRLRYNDRAMRILITADLHYDIARSRAPARQLADLRPWVDRIVVFVHHLVLREQVPAGRPDHFAFASAYMGTERFGRILLACDKVSHVYCGHSHWPDRRKLGHLTVVSIGSTYVDKRLEILEL